MLILVDLLAMRDTTFDDAFVSYHLSSRDDIEDCYLSFIFYNVEKNEVKMTCTDLYFEDLQDQSLTSLFFDDLFRDSELDKLCQAFADLKLA